MKIAYCLNSIRYIGGTQRVTVVKANALAEIEGNEVYLLVTDNKGGVLQEPLSPKVKLIDLDINYYKNDQDRSYLANILIGQINRRKHKKVLRKTLEQIRPDVVISVGLSEKFMIPRMRHRSWKIIREFHIIKYYRKMLAYSIDRKIVAHIAEFLEYKLGKHIFKWDRIVVLSQVDKDTNWKGVKNVSVMPNPSTFKSETVSSLNEKTVVSLGRLDYPKNYASLIRAFGLVAEKHPDWKLKIYGEGSLKKDLQRQIEDANLQENIQLMGYTSDAAASLSQSSIFALSSILEGFALVLVEAMECGVPVVSYQCPYGPKDIITDGKDGYLVPVNDEQAMADHICRLIEDEDLRHRMGAAAKQTAQKYHVDAIAQRWMALFNEVLNESNYSAIITPKIAHAKPLSR